MEKHSVSRLSYPFAHLHLLSSDLVSSDSSHLCFSTVHIVGSFTSKLPSIISQHIYLQCIKYICTHLWLHVAPICWPTKSLDPGKSPWCVDSQGTAAGLEDLRISENSLGSSFFASQLFPNSGSQSLPLYRFLLSIGTVVLHICGHFASSRHFANIVKLITQLTWW